MTTEYLDKQIDFFTKLPSGFQNWSNFKDNLHIPIYPDVLQEKLRKYLKNIYKRNENAQCYFVWFKSNTPYLLLSISKFIFL